ncbi:AAA family ATPase [Vagococcus vulneris]|uniref:YhaN AAA domain-containing protein n=1 Tax=Vagococcus vulneris TaxID=1977869 RepID=A0A429ZXJ6_9ENTE|nr:AAA family ATPase [Vagococcus vulneris]RST98584.1 hypothetical protein CBF37_07355 [Vagococcus vulneris]
MKILSLHIQGFGQFENQSFYLTDGSQLIYGGNESGKSTIYQFIRTMLFGFPKKREQVRDFEPISGAAYGGRIEIEHPVYNQFTIERFKNKNKGQASVTLSDGQTGQEALLEKILNPLTKELFDQVFSFQQEQLTDLAQLDEVRLQHLLLSVGLTGSGELTKISDDLLKDRQQIYKPTGRLPRLNQELKAFRELEAKITDVEKQESTYQTKLSLLGELEEKVLHLENQHDQVMTASRRLAEQQKRFAMYVEYTTLKTEAEATKPTDQLTVMKVQDGLQEYRFLEKKEKDMMAQQAEQTSNVSPAFVFYLDNQELFEKALVDQMTVETLTERRQLVAEQVLADNRKIDALCSTYGMQRGVTDEPLNQQIIKEIEEVSEREELITREKIILGNESSRLGIRQKELNQQLNAIEKTMVEQEGESQAAPKHVSGMTLAQIVGAGLVAVGVICLLLTVLLPKLILIVPAIIFTGAGVISWMQTKPQKGGQPPIQDMNPMMSRDHYRLQLAEADELEYELNKISEKLDTVSNQLTVIEDQKAIWHKLYGFTSTDTLASWLTKIPVVVQLQELQEKAESSQLQLDQIDNELTMYSEQLNFARQWLNLEVNTIREQYLIVRDFVTDQQKAAQTERVNYAQTESYQQSLINLRYERQALLEQLIHVIEDSAVTNVDGIVTWIARQTDWQNNQQQAEELALRLEEYFDLSKSYELAAISDSLIKASTEKEQLEQQMVKTRDDLQAVRYEITAMEKNGTLDYLYQERENYLTVIKQLSDEWLSIRLAEETIQELFQFLSDQQLPSLLKAASNYFNLLTQEKYNQIIVNEGQLVVKDRQRRVLHIEQLSTGTKDQMYIAFRLAFIQMHQRDYGSPLIIDDGWLHFDKERKETLFKLIQVLGKESQVICLSSDISMKQFFDETKQTVITL